MLWFQRLRGLTVLTTFAASLLLAACGGGNDGGATPSAKETKRGVVGSWVGKVEGSDALVSIVTSEDRQTVAYVCDSKTISTWFRGNAGQDSLELTSARGARLKAKLTKEAASGTVALADGRSLNFKAPRTTGDAGLYWASGSGGDPLVGWLVLPDGDQRGGSNTGGTTNPVPRLNTANPTVTVQNAGALTAQLATPFKIIWPPDVRPPAR